MKNKSNTPLINILIITTLLLSACATQVVVPPPQVIQSCSIGAPQAVKDSTGKEWDCASVRAAFVAQTSTPVALATTSAPASTAAPATVASGSLKYDETGGTALVPGQKQLIALYLRLPAPISQAALEAAVAKIQQEAVAANATTFEGLTLKLDQKVAWLVWCSDATKVDPPADVSLVHEITLLAKATVGRV